MPVVLLTGVVSRVLPVKVHVRNHRYLRTIRYHPPIMRYLVACIMGKDLDLI